MRLTLTTCPCVVWRVYSPSSSFIRYVRNVMVTGLALAYGSVLVGAQLRGCFQTHDGLVAIWLAKSAMNVWRLAGLSAEIHFRVH